MKASGKYLAAAQRKLIRSGPVEIPISKFTAALKGGRSRPLIETGGLMKSIDSTTQGWKMAFAGIQKSKTDGAVYARAIRLHYGSNSGMSSGVQIVTQKMRRMFMAIKAFDEGRSDILHGRALEIYNQAHGRIKEWRVPDLGQPIQTPAHTGGQKGWNWAGRVAEDPETLKTVEHNMRLAVARAFDPKIGKGAGKGKGPKLIYK